MAKKKNVGLKEASQKILKLLLTVNDTNNLLHLTTPELTVRQLMHQIGLRHKLTVEAVFIDKIFKVDPHYKVGDVFENGQRVSLTASGDESKHGDKANIKASDGVPSTPIIEQTQKKQKKRDDKGQLKMKDLLSRIKEFASSSESEQTPLKPEPVIQIGNLDESVVVQPRLSSSFEENNSEPPAIVKEVLTVKKPQEVAPQRQISTLLDGFMSSQSDEPNQDKTYLPTPKKVKVNSLSDLSGSDFEQSIKHVSPEKKQARVDSSLSSEKEPSEKKDLEFAEYLELDATKRDDFSQSVISASSSGPQEQQAKVSAQPKHGGTVKSVRGGAKTERGGKRGGRGRSVIQEKFPNLF